MTDKASTATTTPPGIVVPLAQVFRSEIAEVRRLGYRLTTNLTAHAAGVRLIPATQRTKRVAHEHTAAGSPEPAIEATCVYDDPRDRLDALRCAIAAATQLARDAA